MNEDGLEIFSKPVPHRLRPNYLTIQPAGGYLDLQEYGEFTDQTNKGIAQPYERWQNIFHTGDRVYLGITPDGYEQDEEPASGWGYDANTQIVAVRPQNKTIAFTLRNIVE